MRRRSPHIAEILLIPSASAGVEFAKFGVGELGDGFARMLMGQHGAVEAWIGGWF
jgi:hypothetical protein